MISQLPRPFVFIHIPKNAGTSIEKALLKHSTGHQDFKDLPNHLSRKHHLPGLPQAIQHDKYKRYAQLYDLTDHFVFTIVRNPFTRAISQINYLRRNSREARSFFSGNSWKPWLIKLASAQHSIYGQNLGATQMNYLTDFNGKIKCDLIARFETLDEDWKVICQKLELPPIPLPHIFKSQENLDWRECYDEESKELIAAKYSRDLSEFSYSFDG